jgi:hypothetical protein
MKFAPPAGNRRADEKAPTGGLSAATLPAADAQGGEQ